MASLKTLDVGYSYKADGGKTFPFRGKGVGLTPALDEVLARFPGRQFHVNIKSNDPEEGRKPTAFLKMLRVDDRARLTVYGGNAPVDEVKAALPEMRVFSRRLKNCALRYAALGWSGFVLDACRGATRLIPVNVAPWLWGWPDRFLDRMDAADTRVFLVAPYFGGSDALDIVMPAIKAKAGA